MDSVSPVWTEAEVPIEREIAKNQDQYIPVIGLDVSLDIVDPGTAETQRVPNWGTSMRFRLNDEERKAVAEGFDLIVTQVVFGKPITPINFQWCKPGERPQFGLELETAAAELGLERKAEPKPDDWERPIHLVPREKAPEHVDGFSGDDNG